MIEVICQLHKNCPDCELAEIHSEGEANEITDEDSEKDECYIPKYIDPDMEPLVFNYIS